MHPYAWSADAEALVLVPGLCAAYALALRTSPASRARVLAFAAGQALILAVFVTPVETLALHYLLTAHLLQNVVLAEWAPLLVVAGLPPALAARMTRGRLARTLTNPLVALPAWLATYYAWHVPAAYDFALRHAGGVLHVEHLSYLAAGCLVWWPVVHDVPRRISDGARAVYLFAAFVLASPLGLLMALIPRPVYSFYEHAARIWGLSPLADQQLAGATMAAEQAIVLFCVFTLFLLRFLEEGEPYSVSSSARTSSTPARHTSSTSSSGR